jgi:hypothetical protein
VIYEVRTWHAGSMATIDTVIRRDRQVLHPRKKLLHCFCAVA